MSDKIWFDPTSDKWVLSDGEHYLEVPHWAREIIVNEFERETRQLKAENAALREECDGWKKVCVDQEIMRVMHEDAMDNENAKLRELVRDMWIEGMCECGSLGKCASCIYDYPIRMRELGIEVD